MRPLVLILLLASTARADSFDALTGRVLEDLRAGRPLVVQVHVPLCDNDVLACGNARLGDGDRPEHNLYWATSEGVLGWLGRRGGGWTQVLVADGKVIGEPEVLDLRVWRRDVATPAAWQRAGVGKRYRLYLVTAAWRGESIARAFERYADDLYGLTRQRLVLADGTTIAAGGDAHLVAYVGHNHLMDLAGFDWGARKGDATPRGMIAIACHTAVYMQDRVPGPTRAPLLLTRDFLYANAAALEGTVLAFASGGNYAAIRRGAAVTYAAGGKKDVKRVQGAFSNPADRRWGTPAGSEGIRVHAATQGPQMEP
jgi:hypothetical protein